MDHNRDDRKRRRNYGNSSEGKEETSRPSRERKRSRFQNDTSHREHAFRVASSVPNDVHSARQYDSQRRDDSTRFTTGTSSYPEAYRRPTVRYDRPPQSHGGYRRPSEANRRPYPDAHHRSMKRYDRPQRPHGEYRRSSENDRRPYPEAYGKTMERHDYPRRVHGEYRQSSEGHRRSYPEAYHRSMERHDRSSRPQGEYRRHAQRFEPPPHSFRSQGQQFGRSRHERRPPPEHMMIEDQVKTMKRLDVPIGKHIEKQYEFKCSNWSIPKGDELFSSPAFDVEEMKKLEKENLHTKSKLDDFDGGRWGRHTKQTKVGSNVIFDIRKKVRAEFCTRAWVKMYELLHAYELLPSHAEEIPNQGFLTVHLCEAPGAFVSATNHYIQTHIDRSAKWSFRALTLNPYYEENNLKAMVDQDNFIMETKSSWRFGADNSGDIRVGANIAKLAKEVSSMGKADLVTADGSISCYDCPAEQERITAWLHTCETLAALQLLKAGGSFVCKMFTLFEHSSICLVRLLGSLFGRLIVCKPTLSSEGNSETYVVAINFKGCTESLRSAISKAIRGNLGDSTSLLWPSLDDKGVKASILPFDFVSQTSDFMRQMIQCAQLFSELQVDVIERNIRLFGHMSHQKRDEIKSHRYWVSKEFFKRFDVRALGPEGRRVARSMYLSGSAKSTGRMVIQKREKKMGGSLRERQARMKQADEKSSGAVGLTDRTPMNSEESAKVKFGSKIWKMMERMNYVAGQGLGKLGQGISEPIKESNQQGRQGLGFDAVSTVVKKNNVKWIMMQTDRILAFQKDFEGSHSVTRGRQAIVIRLSRFCGAPQLKVISEYHRKKASVLSSAGANLTDSATARSMYATDLDKLVNIIENVDAVENVCIADFSGGNLGVRDLLLGKQSSCVNFDFLELGPLGLMPVDVSNDSARSDSSTDTSARTVSSRDTIQNIKKYFADEKKACNVIFIDGEIAAPYSHVELGSAESLSRLPLTIHIVGALNVLRRSGLLVLRMGYTMTRYTVGVLNLLSKCFEGTAFIQNTSSKTGVNRWVLFHNYAGHQVCSSLVTYLENIVAILESTLEENSDVVEITAIENLFEKSFYSAIVEFNESYSEALKSIDKEDSNVRKSANSSAAGSSERRESADSSAAAVSES